MANARKQSQVFARIEKFSQADKDRVIAAQEKMQSEVRAEVSKLADEALKRLEATYQKIMSLWGVDQSSPSPRPSFFIRYKSWFAESSDLLRPGFCSPGFFESGSDHAPGPGPPGLQAGRFRDYQSLQSLPWRPEKDLPGFLQSDPAAEFSFDITTLGKNGCPFKSVFQLSDVSGPLHAGKTFHKAVRNTQGSFAQFAGKTFEQTAAEFRKIVFRCAAAVLQNIENAEPIQQIFAEKTPFGDHLFEISIRGGNRMRTSTLTGELLPILMISFSCRARSSFACIARGTPPTSSRKTVPWSAASKLPIRRCLASVKAPFHGRTVRLQKVFQESKHSSPDKRPAGPW